MQRGRCLLVREQGKEVVVLRIRVTGGPARKVLTTRIKAWENLKTALVSGRGGRPEAMEGWPLRIPTQAPAR